MMKVAAAAILGAVTLAAFTPADPPAPSSTDAPCAHPAGRGKTNMEFGLPYNAARALVQEKRYLEALDLTRAAYARIGSQLEALAVAQLETAAYAGLGDQGWLLWSLREQLRIGQLCPGLLPEETVRAHQLTIRGLEDELPRRAD